MKQFYLKHQKKIIIAVICFLLLIACYLLLIKKLTASQGIGYQLGKPATINAHPF
tara:strand:+ start:584 stop:748 length:165 start_codon:yes stop_codon:yes gene_type:complete